MGLAAFAALGRLDEAAAFFADSPEAAQLAAIFSARPAPVTTSLGRLFDAAAALLGLRAACRISKGRRRCGSRLWSARRAFWRAGSLCAIDVVDFAPLLAHFIDARPYAREGAELLHGTLIEGLGAWLAASARPGEHIALGGGCLMNRRLAEGLAGCLREKEFRAAAGAQDAAQ